MKYVHVIINSAYTAPYIELVSKNFETNEHLFFVIRGWSETKVKIPVNKNVVPINGVNNILNGFKLIYQLNISKKIIFHGLFSPFLQLLMLLQPWLFRKANWSIWGGDLYRYNVVNDTFYKKLEEFLRRIVLRNFAEITTIIKGDYDLAKKWYNVKGIHKYAMYSVPLKTVEIDKTINSVTKKETTAGSVSVLIGNSAEPGNNHYDIISLLQNFKDQDITIYALLNYGDPDYANKIISHGQSIFGQRFIGITDYMKYDDFILFMNSINILVFNHKRQQALGNLLLAFYLKKKIFVNTESTLFQYFSDQLKLSIGSTTTIEQLTFDQFALANSAELENNKQIITDLLRTDHVIDQWRSLFDK